MERDLVVVLVLLLPSSGLGAPAVQPGPSEHLAGTANWGFPGQLWVWLTVKCCAWAGWRIITVSPCSHQTCTNKLPPHREWDKSPYSVFCIAHPCIVNRNEMLFTSNVNFKSTQLFHMVPVWGLCFYPQRTQCCIITRIVKISGPELMKTIQVGQSVRQVQVSIGTVLSSSFRLPYFQLAAKKSLVATEECFLTISSVHFVCLP